jgi:hypothetical protein
VFGSKGEKEVVWCEEEPRRDKLELGLSADLEGGLEPAPEAGRTERGTDRRES